MSRPPIERRRWPRMPLAGTGEVTEPVHVHAQVLDLGRNGALVASSHPYGLGQSGRLLVNLRGEVFKAGFEVRHVHPRSAGVRVGVRFVDVEPEARRAIDQWIERARR